MRWLGKTNDELLQLMIQNNFTSFLTIDNNLSFQQNFKNYPLQVIIIIAPDNTYETIMQIFQKIIKSLTPSTQKIISIIHPRHSTF